MELDGKTRRSGYPRDLRDAGPAGPMERHWQPEAFSWYGCEIHRAGAKDDPFIYINKVQFRVSWQAARLAGLQPGDRVKVGVNSAFLAVRKDEAGIITRPEKGKNTGAFYIAGSALIRKIQEEEWPVPSRLPVVFDAKSGMLVARKPGGVLS